MPIFDAFFKETLLVTVILSTTQRTADQYQQGNWDANHGADRTVVFDSSIRFDTDKPAGGGLAPFDIKIVFTTPFVYDSSKGNLMLDFYHDRSTPGGANIDVFNSLDPIGYGNALAPGGSRANGTFATEFFYTTVPEPSAACFAACFVGLGWFRAKSRMTRKARAQSPVFLTIILLAPHLFRQSVYCDELILPGNAATQEGPDYSSYPLRDQNGRAQQFYDASSFVISQPVLLLEAVDDILFVERDVYQHLLPREYALCCRELRLPQNTAVVPQT